jgi:CheY-like chemotaxis protein
MKPKILVIEDNEQNLYLITFILDSAHPQMANLPDIGVAQKI